MAQCLSRARQVQEDACDALIRCKRSKPTECDAHTHQTTTKRHSHVLEPRNAHGSRYYAIFWWYAIDDVHTVRPRDAIKSKTK